VQSRIESPLQNFRVLESRRKFLPPATAVKVDAFW
jgi:hypothetical protein